jgi:hypothetical protein
MEEIQLSPEAQREQTALQAATERMRIEGLQLQARVQALEKIARRKEAVIRRQQEFLAEIQAERQDIEAEYQQICSESPAL